MDVEQLYYSDQFQSFLDRLTFKSKIRAREDYKHDVFAEILSVDADSLRDCKRAAWRVADDYIRESKRDAAIIDRSVLI